MQEKIYGKLLLCHVFYDKKAGVPRGGQTVCGAAVRAAGARSVPHGLCRTVFAAGSFRAAAFGYSPSFAPSGRAGMSVASSLNSTGRSPSLQEQIATPGVRIQSL